MYYFSREHRSWEQYAGQLDETILQEVRTFSMTLEGLLRSFDGNIDRNVKGVLTGINNALVRGSKYNDPRARSRRLFPLGGTGVV